MTSIAECKACSVYVNMKLDAKSYPGRNSLRQKARDTTDGLRNGLPFNDKMRSMLCLMKYVFLVLDPTLRRHSDEPRTHKKSKRPLLDLF